jgi:hypothetical protein
MIVEICASRAATLALATEEALLSRASSRLRAGCQPRRGGASGASGRCYGELITTVDSLAELFVEFGSAGDVDETETLFTIVPWSVGLTVPAAGKATMRAL